MLRSRSSPRSPPARADFARGDGGSSLASLSTLTTSSTAVAHIRAIDGSTASCHDVITFAAPVTPSLRTRPGASFLARRASVASARSSRGVSPLEVTRAPGGAIFRAESRSSFSIARIPNSSRSLAEASRNARRSNGKDDILSVTSAAARRACAARARGVARCPGDDCSSREPPPDDALDDPELGR